MHVSDGGQVAGGWRLPLGTHFAWGNLSADLVGKKVKHFCWKMGFSWIQRDRKGKEELLLHRPSVLFSKEVQNHPFSALVTVSKFGVVPLGISSDRSWEMHSMWKSPVFIFLAFGSENQHWKCYFLRVRNRVPRFKMSSKFSLFSYSFTFFPLGIQERFF